MKIQESGGVIMARISVNDEYIVNGKLTVRRFLDEEGRLITTGTFATHYYVEEINKLETYRYTITGIEIQEEVFGSDDFDIVYSFVADNIDIRNGMSNLSNEEIRAIENSIYNKEGYLLGSNLAKKGAE